MPTKKTNDEPVVDKEYIKNVGALVKLYNQYMRDMRIHGSIDDNDPKEIERSIAIKKLQKKLKL